MLNSRALAPGRIEHSKGWQSHHQNADECLAARCPQGTQKPAFPISSLGGSCHPADQPADQLAGASFTLENAAGHSCSLNALSPLQTSVVRLTHDSTALLLQDAR